MVRMCKCIDNSLSKMTLIIFVVVVGNMTQKKSENQNWEKFQITL